MHRSMKETGRSVFRTGHNETPLFTGSGTGEGQDTGLHQEMDIPFVHLVDDDVSNFRQFRVPNEAA